MNDNDNNMNDNDNDMNDNDNDNDNDNNIYNKSIGHCQNWYLEYPEWLH